MNPLFTQGAGAPAATVILAAILILSVIGLFVAPSVIERNLFRPYWLLRNRELYTVVTSGFIHADVAHLAFNAITFYAFAFTLERTIGTPAFVALYAMGLLVSDAGTWLKHRGNPDYRSLGASGAILAVLFCFIVYHPSARLYLFFVPVPVPAPLFAVGYLAYTWWAAKQSRGRINHDAHLWGALAGMAFVVLTDPAALQRAMAQLLS